MAFIPTNRQPMKLICITCHQSLFLFSAPSLNLFFTIERVIDAVAFLTVNKFYGKPPGCMIRAQSVLMLPKTAIQILGASRVVAAVRAFEDVHVGHAGYSPKPGFDSAQPPKTTAPANGDARWLSGAEARP
ncbi:hypothetical protein Gura_2096 [Geotalea uraniireducens Rf4]|uniref:Uncharacterized protein n=1 Tax=Geotalea uraniireducens (strain Rf4) TaxID=351605 RepID=A5G3B8_GEOUR|nr:hypothetical protein Gura_2096 [Geotalea uraniireducens Rf4]